MQEKIKVKNFGEALSYVKNNDLKEILEFIKKENEKFCSDNKFNRDFVSEKEIVSMLKEEIQYYLKDSYEDLKSELSELRKKGFKVIDLTFRLMSIPLKSKMLKVGYSKKDFGKIISLISYVKSGINSFDIKEE